MTLTLRTVVLHIIFISVSADVNVPVIGILSLPCLPEIAAEDCPSWVGFNATSYIAASYVKFLESGGAKVVPVLVTDPLQDISHIVSQLNGILFTGGTEYFNSDSIYYNQVQNILHTLRQFHHENPGKNIPLWATCLGFQAMICATAKAGASLIQSGYNDYHTPHTINFTSHAKRSRIFNNFTMPVPYSNMVYTKMSTMNVTQYDHGSGFDPNDLVHDKYAHGNFSIIGTAFAEKSGKTFVALVEDKLGLSWYGAQFHPEKPQYEFVEKGVHDLNAIVVNQYLAEFFVNECRIQNDNKMDEDTLNDIVIYNDAPYFVDKYDGGSFEQNYLFP